LGVVGVPPLGVELGGAAAGEVPVPRGVHAGAETAAKQRPGVRDLRRLEHRAPGDRPGELARKPQELGFPPGGARLAHADVRRGRLGGRVPSRRPATEAIHLVVEPRPGLGEERRLAHRLPDRDAGDRGESEAREDLQGEALLGSRPFDDRLRREALMPSSYLEVFRSPRLAVILVLGFSSGLPLALTGGTLQAWMTVEGVDLSTIGIFTLVGLPYVWKFLWAPAMDRFVPPFLGRRRGWLVLTQLALALGIAAMAFLSPRSDLGAIAWLALFVAFASASQDIVVDAYRTDVVSREERGLAGALGVVGYRVAMLVSGALALIL